MGRCTFLWMDADPISYKVAVLCGNVISKAALFVYLLSHNTLILDIYMYTYHTQSIGSGKPFNMAG